MEMARALNFFLMIKVYFNFIYSNLLSLKISRNKMKRSILFSIILFVAFSISAHAQQNNAQGQQTANQGQQNSNQMRTQRPQPPESTEWYYPVPQKVQPGTGTKPPSDAIILFDGK